MPTGRQSKKECSWRIPSPPNDVGLALSAFAHVPRPIACQQQTRGFSTFGVSPDGQKLCLMQQDMTTGFYTISVLEGGEGALDPLSTSTMEQVSQPMHARVSSLCALALTGL